MVDEGATGLDLSLDELASSLDKEFHTWVKLDPLGSVPRFQVSEVGPDTGHARFGVFQELDRDPVCIDPAMGDVVSAIVLREVAGAYFPPTCRVDIVYDMINRFCGHFAVDSAGLRSAPFNTGRWQALVQAHSRPNVVP